MVRWGAARRRDEEGEATELMTVGGIYLRLCGVCFVGAGGPAGKLGRGAANSSHGFANHA